MEWIKSDNRIKTKLYTKKNGDINKVNYNIYYCSNCGYNKIIKVGSEKRLASCPLCGDNNISRTYRCNKSRIKQHDINNTWESQRKHYRHILAKSLHNQCECCKHTFDFDDLVIHHIVPHKGNKELMHDFSNMYLCCPECHTLIHKWLCKLDDTNKKDCLTAIRKAKAMHIYVRPRG